LDFAERLFLSLAHGRGHVVSDSEAILGRSGIDTDPLKWAGQQTAYRSSSRHGRLLLRYADKDSTFRSFLASAGIDLRRLETLRGPDRAKTVRKMAQVVPLRDAFRTADDVASVTGRRVRSRKQAPVFAGSRGFYAMTEGNPRWIIGIGNKLLDRADSKGRVSPSVQSTEIGAAANRFRALLRTLSFPDSGGRGFLKTLDTLGEYVHQRVVLDPFTIDPIGSFIVDSHPPSWLERWVETALYVGAIVHVPSKNDVSLLTSIRGKRFRLAYIFSPGYGIPVRLGRGVSLLKALESSGSSAVLPEAQPLFSRSDESC